MTGAPPRWVVRKFGSNVSNRCEAGIVVVERMTAQSVTRARLDGYLVVA